MDVCVFEWRRGEERSGASGGRDGEEERGYSREEKRGINRRRREWKKEGTDGEEGEGTFFPVFDREFARPSALFWK
ncbi:hypothetical protein AgCh_024998 [Apium graveolens]